MATIDLERVEPEQIARLTALGIIRPPVCHSYAAGCICTDCKDRADRFLTLVRGIEGVRDPMSEAEAAVLAASDAPSTPAQPWQVREAA